MPAQVISFFDVWQEGYALATVRVEIAGTATLADIFTDEALTVAADNPQTLETLTINDRTFGKFAAPLYTASAYHLDIDSTDQTGVLRVPLTTLVGEDASAALVTATGGLVSHTLAEISARTIDVRDHGVFLNTGDPGQSSSTNNATLTAAIGAAASQGGGDVLCPSGTFAFTTLTIPAAVRVVGQGHDATVLQSQVAGKVITLSGDEAGFDQITIDGVNLQAGSTGIYAKAIDYTSFGETLITRFETGLHMQGGRNAEWTDLFITNCVTGAKLHGDSDPGGGADGDEFRHNLWQGGGVALCTTIGVELSFEDMKCYHNSINDVGFLNNTGTALIVNGSRFTNLEECWWSGNTKNWQVTDDDDTDNSDINTVVGLHIEHGSVIGGTASFTGKCQGVILDQMEISDVDFTLTSPLNNIVVRDCTEDSLVTLAGDGTKWTRLRTIQGSPPGSSGITTDATPTKAWSVGLNPGQRGHLRAIIIANQRNGTGYAMYHISRPVHRPGSTLDYDAQTVNFTAGETVTGTTSGATALITADSDSGDNGTLTLRDIEGTFENNEPITDGLGGAATVNGTISDVDAALLGSTASITAAVESDAAWAADFAIAAGEVEVEVTGEAAKTIEWLVQVEVVLD